ncbi:MAG: CopG family transcriptional regulator [Armatimonadota bacterium]|nr:CopG family transcriptional regulator [Armatimonadota bacterium]MDR7577652.1 CopG family transcriptional regulator [Armatimonadota bacterium]MDR7580840.1 CopG family transcriptional regulator [Armatimonadota bacterium]
MVRTQIQLTEEQVAALRRLSAERGVSMAELVREALDAMLRTHVGPSWEERRKRALAAVGKFASGRRDVSIHHDRDLDEAYSQ